MVWEVGPVSGDDDAWCSSTPKRLEPEAGSGALRSVGSALDVLECFATDAELGVSDIARRLGIAKSTAHRLLQTLLSRGFIEQHTGTGQYRLGLHVYELGQLAQARNAYRHAALPILREVATTCRHTVNFSVPDGADVVFIERIEIGEGARILGHAGRRFPSHTTSSGKVIAAFNPAAEAARRAAGFPPRSTGTVRNLVDWQRQVSAARRSGFATSTSESFEGASSVAVPVLVQGVAVAAVSTLGEMATIQADTDRLVPLLTAASRRIARAVSR